jgi:hypothetical protein
MGATLVASGAQNSERWYQEVQNLMLTLRRVAGDLAGAPCRPARSAPADEP